MTECNGFESPASAGNFRSEDVKRGDDKTTPTGALNPAVRRRIVVSAQILFTAGIAVLVGGLLYRMIDMPISEDMGFYGTISRYIQDGILPHRDIPMGTNSIGLYLQALVFSVFGHSAFVFRVTNIVYCLLAMLTFILFASKVTKSFWLGSIAAALAAIVSITPHMQLGGGRNFLFLTAACLFFSLFCFECALERPATQLFGRTGAAVRVFLAGVFLSLVSLTNESCLPITVVIGLYWGFVVFRRNRKALLVLGGGVLLPFALFTFALLILGQFSAYVSNMVHIGGGSRMPGWPISSLIANHQFWALGFRNVWGWSVIGYGIAVVLLLKSKNTVLDGRARVAAGFVYCPAILLWVFIFSSTREYHIQMAIPILALFASAVVYDCLFAAFANWRRFSDQIRPFVVWVPLPALLVAGWIVVTAVKCGVFIRLDFQNGLDVSENRRRMVETAEQAAGDSEHSRRIANRLRHVRYRTLSAFSQYDALFLLENIRFKVPGPFLPDLSLPANSGGSVPFASYEKALKEDPPDVLVLKTTSGGFPSRHDPFFGLCDEQFRIVGELSGASPFIAAYVDRVLFSKRFLEDKFVAWSADIASPFAGIPLSTLTTNDSTAINAVIPATPASPESVAVMVVDLARPGLAELRIAQGAGVFKYEPDQQTGNTYYFLANPRLPTSIVLRARSREVIDSGTIRWLTQVP